MIPRLRRLSCVNNKIEIMMIDLKKKKNLYINYKIDIQQAQRPYDERTFRPAMKRHIVHILLTLYQNTSRALSPHTSPSGFYSLYMQ